MLKEQIKYLGQDMNLKFTLSSDDSFLGYQQEIDNLTQNIGDDLINPPVDVEERRFKYKPSPVLTTINFYFTQNGVSYSNTLTGVGGNVSGGAGFSGTELSLGKPSVTNSFYILDLYDTYDINTQTKILSTYLTKIRAGVGTTSKPYPSSYKLNSSNQFYYLYIPMYFINENLDMGITGITGYTKFTFYTAKSGEVKLFYNELYGDESTPLKMFFPVFIDIANQTWNFMQGQAINARQLWSSQDYVNKMNETFTDFDNKTQNYPSGNSFDFITGKYFTNQ